MKIELIQIEAPPKTAESIRDHYNNLQEYGSNMGLGRALENGAEYVRQYYNNKNLRKRIVKN